MQLLRDKKKSFARDTDNQHMPKAYVNMSSQANLSVCMNAFCYWMETEGCWAALDGDAAQL